MLLLARERAIKIALVAVLLCGAVSGTAQHAELWRVLHACYMHLLHAIARLPAMCNCATCSPGVTRRIWSSLHKCGAHYVLWYLGMQNRGACFVLWQQRMQGCGACVC
jgi:hypothetical protein